jgi:hypothetical protein
MNIKECPRKWENMPVWAEFLTIDSNGEVNAWEWKPVFCMKKFWVRSNNTTRKAFFGTVPVNPDNAEQCIWKRPDKQK